MKIIITSPLDEFELEGFKGGNQRISEAIAVSRPQKTGQKNIDFKVVLQYI